MPGATSDIGRALAEPFPAGEVEFRPGAAKGNRAIALAYITSRHVMDRLDAVVGVGGWQDEYAVLNDGSVVCRLTLDLGCGPVTKCDVGGMSEQPDGGDRMKAAFSDSLKRAAVKFGVGRYLYALPVIWCDYDPQTKRFTREPALPDFARPKVPPPPVADAPEAEAAPVFGYDADVNSVASIRRLVAELLPIHEKRFATEAELLEDLYTTKLRLPADCRADDLRTLSSKNCERVRVALDNALASRRGKVGAK